MVEREQAVGAFRCSKCGTVTSGNLKFCSECGEALDIVCLACGEKWRYVRGYTFCPSCGTRAKKKL